VSLPARRDVETRARAAPPAVWMSYAGAVVRIELTVRIRRPAQDVFELMIDLERLPEWQSSALEARSDGPLQEGSRIVEQRHVLGRHVENELEVTVFEPPRRLTLKALRGPVRFTVAHELVEEEEDRSTLVQVVAEGQPGRLTRLAEPFLARAAEQEMRRDFDRLKELAEGR
jgi:uncharacterized membrane protein